ncbi:hypothetical protein [Methylobacterium nodulans]|uniref:Uncharacterized protein n=1 Tax=Methylobacterium nodulans (strain LMG 21967 / CNCM I-2342 / ORS 2060) TaxID=460265 RepID=B8IY63_METNO|nr:hypothetical protein [Methylobacterium nodulans]ACL63353.1 conserved hypothetical protein [Methylobacterium nodulans ORS 2060]
MAASLMGMSIRVMTYDEIASEMGLKPASARQLVRRNGWHRVPGNDGRTRVEVPLDELERHIKDGAETPVEAEETSTADAPESPFEAPLITALSNHIERLERALADAETALSAAAAERGEAQLEAASAREASAQSRAQIDVLSAQLEAAERRAAELAEDRDRWHAAATARRSWWPWRRTG